MHVNIHYDSGTREERDEKALADIREYISDEGKFKLLTDAAKAVTQGTYKVGKLDMIFGFIGVTGYPFHAFCRRYCREQYVAWMNEDAKLVDEEGWPL